MCYSQRRQRRRTKWDSLRLFCAACPSCISTAFVSLCGHSRLQIFLPNYARYLFRSPIYRQSVFPLAQGSTRYNLAKTSFLKLKLPVPHPDEQRKIADFLSALDDKTAAVSAQIGAMQTFKKGLLQQMFV